MDARASDTHVLLVEDNPHIARLTTYFLSQRPVHVVVDHVESGEAALAYLHQNHPDRSCPCPGLIVLDLCLPGMGGLEVLQRLKRYPAWSGIPVVIFTSLDDETSRRTAAENGATEYLLKPIGCEEWEHVVSELCNQVQFLPPAD